MGKGGRADDDGAEQPGSATVTHRKMAEMIDSFAGIRWVRPITWASYAAPSSGGLGPAASLGDMTLLNMDPDQLLSTTRAVRKRLDFSRPVPDQLIRECVAMALQAPSGSNVVTMRFVVVRDEKKRQAIGEIYRQVYAQYKASPSYPGNPTGEPERDSVQRRVASSADYLGEHMGDAPVLVVGCNEGRDRVLALAGLGNILPAMWSFMLAARARAWAPPGRPCTGPASRTSPISSAFPTTGWRKRC